MALRLVTSLLQSAGCLFPHCLTLQGSGVWCEGPNGYLVPGIVKVQCSKDNVKVELDANEVHCMLLGAGFVAS